MPSKNSRRTARPKTRAKAAKTSAARLRGRGGYIQDAWNAGKKYIPRIVGGALGSLIGHPTSGWEVGGDFSKKVLGWGDYTAPWSVSMNSLVTHGQTPVVANIAESGMRMSHREYIGTVYSSTTFTNNVYYFNPGISATCPWLSKIASNFQQYELMGCLITFKSSLTDAVASFSSLGSVILAADMNAAAVPASSQLQMEQMQFVASAKPSDCVVAPIECAPKLGGAGVRYIRTSAVPAAASILDYDHCTIQVATSGQPVAGVELGRLYLSYDVKLLNPKMSVSNTTVASYSFTPTAGYMYGIAPATKVYDLIGLTFAHDGTGYKSVTIPAGSGSEFVIDYYITAGAALTGGAISQTLTNCTTSSRTLPTGAAYLTSPENGVNCLSWAGTWVFHITDPSVNATVLMTGLPFAATSVKAFLDVTMLPPVGVVTCPAPGMNFVYRTEDEKKQSDEKCADYDPIEDYVAGPAAAPAAAAGAPRSFSTPGRRTG